MGNLIMTMSSFVSWISTIFVRHNKGVRELQTLFDISTWEITLNTQLIEMGIIMSVGIKKQRHYTSISYMLHEE
jgi:hypothetical protein